MLAMLLPISDFVLWMLLLHLDAFLLVMLFLEGVVSDGVFGFVLLVLRLLLGALLLVMLLFADVVLGLATLGGRGRPGNESPWLLARGGRLLTLAGDAREELSCLQRFFRLRMETVRARRYSG